MDFRGLFKGLVPTNVSAPAAVTPGYSFLDLVKGSHARKDAAELRLRYYKDRQSDELLRLIRGRWSRAEQFRLFQINVVKKIIHRRATAYAVPPVRTFKGMDQATGEAIYTALNADVVLKKANRLTKLLKTTVLQVAWTDHGPALSVLTPNILDAIADDPEHPDRLIVSRRVYDAMGRIVQNGTTYSDWTETSFTKRNSAGAAMLNPGNPDNVNPYGILPFVPLFDEAPDDVFFLPGGEDLIEAQSAINVALTNLWRAIEMQSHGQAWAAGVPVGDAIQTGPDRAISLPENGKFGFASPNTPITEVLGAIEFLLKQTAIANDLAANVFEMTPKAESGAAKAFENRDLQEARRDDQEMWRTYEARLFDVVKTVINTHAPVSIPATATVSVDFGEVGESLAERDRLECYQRRIDLGVWSPIDCLMSDNPDFRDRTEALAELKRRREETSALGIGFAPVPFNPTDPMNPGGNPVDTAKAPAP